MGSIRISLHPSFFLFGLYYAIRGRILTFTIYTITALLHEAGHSYVAQKLGYKLNRIVLMPYGAMINGDISGLKLKDEIKIALSGPMVNIAISVFLIALWWIFPLTYPYTEEIVSANLAVAAVNILPVFPLDGGRIFTAVIKSFYKEKTALLISRIIGGILAAVLVALFFLSAFYGVNFSLLFYALFLLSGIFSRRGDNGYIKIFTAANEENLKRGMEIKKLAISENAKIKDLISLLSFECLNEVEVYGEGRKKATLKGDKLFDLINGGDIYTTIKERLFLQ